MESIDLKKLGGVLSQLSGGEFSDMITGTILGLSPEDVATVNFAFWFCYVVEKDLDYVLQDSFRKMEEVYGKTPDNLYDFIRDTFQIKLEVIDPTNPKHDPMDITFNNRIDIAEKLQGKGEHTEFLREIKKIRNNLSHQRIDSLEYEGENISDNSVKAKMINDYMRLCINMKELETKGGVLGMLNETDKEIIDSKLDL